MNGRVYDYNLGKFMSVDPFIQSPTNSQSFNPYSYIMNNPLAGTDPTGYVSVGTNASNWRTSACDLDPMGCVSTPVDRALDTYVGSGQNNMHQSLVNNLQKFSDRMEKGVAAIEQAWNVYASAFGKVTITDLDSKQGGSTTGKNQDKSTDEQSQSDVSNLENKSFLERHINFNPVKMGVGVANGANSIRLAFQSKALAYASTFSFGIGQPQFGVPLAALSVVRANSSIKAAQRSGIQIGEAFAETYGDASLRNLMGLLPNGQHIDDLNEPSITEFYKQKFTEMSTWDAIGEAGTMF